MYKKYIKKIFNFLGLEINKLNASSNPKLQLAKILIHNNFNLVLDIGANEGQFAIEIQKFGYMDEILSFEPLDLEHAKLIKKSKDYVKWSVYEKCAIGSTDGFTSINVSKNSVSSSLLPILDRHVASAEDSIYINTQKVPIYSMDTIFRNLRDLENKKIFMKIDVQGYEWEVLKGARESLAFIDGLVCELSILPLYEGQALYKQVISLVESYGFNLHAIQKGFLDKSSGQGLQFDAVFIKNTQA